MQVFGWVANCLVFTVCIRFESEECILESLNNGYSNEIYLFAPRRYHSKRLIYKAVFAAIPDIILRILSKYDKAISQVHLEASRSLFLDVWMNAC